MSHRQEVVVVDGLPETTQVLRAVLEPRGLHVSRRTSRQVPLESSAKSSRVLVLHDATDPVIDGPCVVVGRIVNPTDVENDSRSLPLPFHYADLIAAIDAVMEPPEA